MLPIQRTDYHFKISHSVVRGDVPGSNLHGAQPPLVIASNLCKVDPHDECFNSLFSLFLPSTVFFRLWVPPFHSYFLFNIYLLNCFFSILWRFPVPFYVTKPLVKLERHFIGTGEELLLVLYYVTVRRAWFFRFCVLCVLWCYSFFLL